MIVVRGSILQQLKKQHDFINSLSEEERSDIEESLMLFFFWNWEDYGQGLWSALDDQIKGIEDAGQEDSSRYPKLIDLRKKVVDFIKQEEHGNIS